MDPLVEIHGDSEPLLVVENVSVRRNRTNVLNDVNLKVHSGEFIGIVGPNGGGKSTLIQAILGILKCQSGQILVAANRPMSKAVYGKVAWVSQAAANLPQNVRLTVRELVRLGMMNLSLIHI